MTSMSSQVDKKKWQKNTVTVHLNQPTQAHLIDHCDSTKADILKEMSGESCLG